MEPTTPPVPPNPLHPLLAKAFQQLWPYILVAIGFALRHYLPGITLPPQAPAAPAITTPAPTQPAAPNMPAAPAMTPLAATAKLVMSDGFCSCTFIGPQRCPGRWDALCAAHCFHNVGQSAEIRLRDGSRLTGVVATIDRRADFAWVIVTTPLALPYLELATTPPAVGSDVWCAGFGPPANGAVRNGKYIGLTADRRQCHYRLVVYHGDSGSAVVDSRTGKVIGIVCTTANGDTFGGSCGSAAAGRPATCPNTSFSLLPLLTA